MFCSWSDTLIDERFSRSVRGFLRVCLRNVDARPSDSGWCTFGFQFRKPGTEARTIAEKLVKFQNFGTPFPVLWYSHLPYLVSKLPFIWKRLKIIECTAFADWFRVGLLHLKFSLIQKQILLFFFGKFWRVWFQGCSRNITILLMVRRFAKRRHSTPCAKTKVNSEILFLSWLLFVHKLLQCENENYAALYCF